MFLKRIELQGFKSFADKSVLLFEEGVTGIVGPNGCGKSNVNDAIRWVLGEQSSKSLRSGTSMTDIIFSGSKSRKPVNLARVSLVFDNTARVFDSPFDEIEITREIRRSNGESSCYINKTPCRLKDISDLVMDTGLGRDSLSIITQGNISSFADAKPEERRLLFEEAAGVAKYKKRKKTSLSRLEGMQANLDRVQDLIDSYQEQIEALQEQAQKARQYTQYKEELSSMEISWLTSQITTLQQQSTALSEKIGSSALQQEEQAARQSLQEDSLQTIRKELMELDNAIASLQSEYTRAMEESYALQRRKVELDEKRKYALEQADSAARLESLTALLQDARFEYEDRRKRYGALAMEYENQQRQITGMELDLSARQRQLQDKQARLQQLTSRKLIIENKLAAPYAHQQGVNAVLKARNSLEGIEGTVSMLMESEPEHAQAISAAIGGAADQIVAANEESARKAIGFLKRSKAGRATFLPLSVCRPKTLYDNQKAIAQTSDGILGVASDFVSCAPRYEAVKGRLLGNILIADNLEHANAAARRLKYQIKIVTLDGDVVHAGGAMSGGSMRPSAQNSLISLRHEKQEVQEKINALQAEINTVQKELTDQSRALQQAKEVQIQTKVDAGKLESILRVKKEKYESLNAEYEQLNAGASLSDELPEDTLVADLSRIHETLDSLTSTIQLKRNRRQELFQESEQLEGSLRQLRREQSALEKQIHTWELEKTRQETKMEQALMRLNSEYSLTYEAALEVRQEIDYDTAPARIAQLRTAMNKLGSVNLQAPEQLAAIEEKHDFLSSQKQELLEASQAILDAIQEMDQTMISQFSSMFEKINGQLDGIFKAMFGGGRASLSMTDPEDVLNTGIDIDVQPPGKMVKNIQTFSGGEKALIAISVLFAILKARTMPLCIFDEVEAALDQANVERFARYLSQFKDQSQFIVVTHRPGTMEQCDRLYGVTMQKDGVSQVLKVQLQDQVPVQAKEN